MAKVKYTIKGIDFKSNLAAQEHAKAILYKDLVNSCLTGSDLDFMLDYFGQLHCGWEEKRGVGIKNIRRLSNIEFGSAKHRTFKIERIDGSDTDISYQISNIQKDKNWVNVFKKALRSVIYPQIIEFKLSKFDENAFQVCEVSKEVLDYYNCHVDHYPLTFDAIVMQFISDRNITDFESLIAPSKDNQMAVELSDNAIGNDFFNYHKQVASLRLLTPIANLSTTKQAQKQIQ